MSDAFLDTNVVAYLLSNDIRKATRAEHLVAQGAVISAQVLNEFVNVARRKFRLDWELIEQTLAPVKGLCQIEPITGATHDLALSIARRYGFGVYDSCILATALMAGCTTVWSEDMQDGQAIYDVLRVRNPFA